MSRCIMVARSACEFLNPNLCWKAVVVRTYWIAQERAGVHTGLAESSGGGWARVWYCNLLRVVVFLKLPSKIVQSIRLRPRMLDPCPRKCTNLKIWILTSGIAFNRFLSLPGNSLTSVFSLNSAASPLLGLLAALGLSLAETQLATPGSGGSRCVFA